MAASTSTLPARTVRLMADSATPSNAERPMAYESRLKVSTVASTVTVMVTMECVGGGRGGGGGVCGPAGRGGGRAGGGEAARATLAAREGERAAGSGIAGRHSRRNPCRMHS